MANTYYDSRLDDEEIEAALEAISGLIVPANNGKVIAIKNGKFEARSVQWGGGGAVVQPLSVTQNGTYNPPSGVDGYAPVTVNVSGGGIVVNLLDEYQVEWWDRSSYAISCVVPDFGIFGYGSNGLAICTTKTPIDFTGKSKIKANVTMSTGQYNTLSRIAVSEKPITNSNRGDVYTQFLDGPGEYELVLPEQKTSLYVAVEIWTSSYGLVPSIIAE